MRRSPFRQLLGLPDDLPAVPGTKSISYDPTDMRLSVTGYDADEVRDLLAEYREHQEAMLHLMEKAAEMNSRIRSDADAVRYTPGATFGPEDIMGGE